MTFRTLDKNRVDHLVTSTTGINANHSELLRRYWHDCITAKERAAVDSLLQDLHDKKKWLACDCLGESETRPPIIGVACIADAGTYYLRRNTGRENHTESCCFKFERSELRKKRLAANTPDGCLDENDVPDYMEGISDESATASGGSSGITPPSPQEGSGTKDDSLYKRLMHLIHGAKLNHVTAKPMTYQEQWAAISGFETDQVHPRNPNLTLKTLQLHFPECMSQQGLEDQFHRIAEKWPSGERAHAYALFVATGITHSEDGRTAIDYKIKQGMKEVGGRSIPNLVSKSIEVEFTIKVPAREGESSKAPYLVLAKALADSAGKPRWIRAYAQPIETETSFVPVDSDLERDALAKLRCIAKVQETHNRKYTILKPVLGIKTSRGLCRPDFIVRRNGRRSVENTIVVETMGYESSEYRSRKTSTHYIMEAIGEIFEDERAASSPKEADERLWKYLTAWFIKSGEQQVRSR